MSVSIEEVLTSAGYNINKLDDARWLLAQKYCFEEMISTAEGTIERAESEEHERVIAELEAQELEEDWHESLSV